MILGIFGALRGVEIYEILRVDVELQADGSYKIYFFPVKTRTSNADKLFFIIPIGSPEFSPAFYITEYIRHVKVPVGDATDRFLKNWNVKAKKYVQNSGLESVKKNWNINS